MTDLIMENDGTVKGDVRFAASCPEFDVAGIPAREMIMSIELGPCVYCGALPKESDSGSLANITVDARTGVLSGDMICATCEPIDFILGDDE